MHVKCSYSSMHVLYLSMFSQVTHGSGKMQAILMHGINSIVLVMYV